jgi:hypothetical protein
MVSVAIVPLIMLAVSSSTGNSRIVRDLREWARRLVNLNIGATSDGTYLYLARMKVVE